MSFLIGHGIYMRDRWQAALAKICPDREIRTWDDPGDLSKVTFALMWQADEKLWEAAPNLKVLFCIGAGVDSLVRQPNFPRHIPLVRMVDPDLAKGMAEYITASVLYHHRQFPGYQSQQNTQTWKDIPADLAYKKTVGFLGWGNMAKPAAAILHSLGLNVQGWKRTAPDVDAQDTATLHVGQEGFANFLSTSDFLINLLPLTKETSGILNAKTFSQLPKGAVLISAGRGGHLVQDDLIPALDAGILSAATLDVTTPEPLPENHPFWSHPKIQLTPHIAAVTFPETGVAHIAQQIARFDKGLPLQHVVNTDQGY